MEWANSAFDRRSSVKEVQRYSVKKVFLKISQNSQEKVSFLLRPAIKSVKTLLKKRLWRRCPFRSFFSILLFKSEKHSATSIIKMWLFRCLLSLMRVDGLYTAQKMKFSIKDFFSKCD